MELVIVASAIIAGGVICAGFVLAWALYFKPKLRRRYERKHHRSKGNTNRLSS